MHADRTRARQRQRRKSDQIGLSPQPSASVVTGDVERKRMVRSVLDPNGSKKHPKKITVAGTVMMLTHDLTLPNTGGQL